MPVNRCTAFRPHSTCMSADATVRFRLTRHVARRRVKSTERRASLSPPDVRRGLLLLAGDSLGGTSVGITLGDDRLRMLHTTATVTLTPSLANARSVVQLTDYAQQPPRVSISECNSMLECNITSNRRSTTRCSGVLSVCLYAGWRRLGSGGRKADHGRRVRRSIG